MTSQHDDNLCDDTSSSLGDSSYDFVDDRSVATTDDEDRDAMTESITSSDGHDFDQPDVRQLQGKSGDSGGRSSHSHGFNNSSSQETHSESDPSSGRESDLQASTDQTALKQLKEQQEAIEFVEPSVTNLNCSRSIEVSHTLTIIDGQDAPVSNFYPNMLERRSGKVAVTVRQTMASHGLQLRGRPYKILYVGDSSMRDVIVRKIATALAASLNNSSSPYSEKPRPSRFNVVPISAFGEEASPEVVLIDSSGLELSVEECNFASFARNEGGNDTIRMQLSDECQVVSSWSSSKFVISSDWRTPDIAVICLSDRDSVVVKQTCRIARSFMSRHAVQTIVVTEISHWDSHADSFTLDHLTPHIHLESRESMGLDRNQTVRRLPIDLATFLSIDAVQMNRNLACLDAGHGSSKGCAPPKVANSRGSSHDRLSFQEIYDGFVTDIRKDGLKGLNRYEYMAGFVVMLMSVLGMVVVGFGLTGILGASRVSNSRVFPTNVAFNSALSISTLTTATAAPLSLPSFSDLAPSLASSTAARVLPVWSLSTDTDIASFLLDAYALAPNKSEQFKVHVLGDCHIVLRPPHWIGKMKKAPKLLFKITRGDKTLEHQISTLFDGVYALQIPREDSYGMLNVAVWTESKPKIKESLEVDFGSSWFKVAGWKKAFRVLTESIRGELNSVQTSLSIFYAHTRTGLSESLQQQRAKIAAQREAEKAMLHSHLEAAAKMKKLVVAQTKGLIRSLSGTMHDGHAAASYALKQHTENITRDLAVYVRNKTSMIFRQSHILARTATRSNVKTLRGLGVFSQRHLRETQKKALQILWKVGGVPKKTTKVKGQGKGPLHGGKIFVRRDEL
ncbi:MAG: hypothetical protein Q9175_000383 [Cornicularia normoerica]